MQHSFDIKIAELYGIEAAVILNNIEFWTAKNIANHSNYYDGKHWIYNSVRAWSELFPYMSANTIRNSLKKLEENNILISGNYNQIAYDRTKWYAIVDSSKSIYQKEQMDLLKLTNGLVEIDKPIPIINTIINTVDIPIINNNNKLTITNDIEELINYFNFITKKNKYQKGIDRASVIKMLQSIIKAGDTVEDIKNLIDYKISNPNTKKFDLTSWLNSQYVGANMSAAKTWLEKGKPKIAVFNNNQQLKLNNYHAMGDFTGQESGEVEF